jgi:hypothetical protein
MERLRRYFLKYLKNYNSAEWGTGHKKEKVERGY